MDTSNLFTTYTQSVSSKFSHKETSEMGYRADFENLLKGIFEAINVQPIGHDDKAKQGNKPDFVIKKNGAPILYIETKDIGISLDKIEKSEQMARYFGYSNLILTDYLEFRFYRNGYGYGEPIKIADYDLKERTVKARSENYDLLAKTLIDFAQSHKEPIKSGAHLAKIMGGKAQRIRDNIQQFLGGTSEQNKELFRVYEDFRKEYEPALRKKMGAYYTPLPVVNFIVRSVDHILKKDFGLAQGLAYTAKLPDGKHKVQILDPAVGTGTFISATIRIIYEYLLKQKQEGRWPAYVHNDLLPRLHGFELMMAPYTIAHLKLSLAFKQTGFWKFHRRLGIYLTNSLEQTELTEDLFFFGLAESIAEEAKEATVVKNATPIMVILGNPPYSVSSSNKGEWIQNLIKVYKTGLGEKKINLDDDHIKFLRFAEHFIEKNQTGVVAMITNNSFIDGTVSGR